MPEMKTKPAKPVAVSRRIIKGLSRCERCNKTRLECRRIAMSDGSKIVACTDCMSAKAITGKKRKKLIAIEIPTAFESSRRRH